MGRLLNESDVYALFAPNGMAHLHVGHIDVLPRVDARPVVHGRWIPSTLSVRQFRCSICREWTIKHSPDAPNFNYCPNCGAKMDKEKDE